MQMVPHSDLGGARTFIVIGNFRNVFKVEQQLPQHSSHLNYSPSCTSGGESKCRWRWIHKKIHKDFMNGYLDLDLREFAYPCKRCAGYS